MQTFLPSENFKESAELLDMRRLGKQRVESYQIYQVLTAPTGRGWRNHPAVLMWQNHLWWLLHYSIEVCVEWRRRGYRDSLLPKFLSAIVDADVGEHPFWLGDERLHSSHRANLLRKDPIYYGRFGWVEDSSTEYHWPVRIKDG